jgi:hypothetical protein
MDSMKKVIEYSVIVHYVGATLAAEAYQRFQDKINDSLREGWFLQGGVSVSSMNGGHVIMAQAIVKYENDAPN